MMFNLGDSVVEVSYHSFAVVDRINGVYPVRYNGINNAYELCDPSKAQHMAIEAILENDENTFILVPTNGKCNAEFLIDAVVGV